MTGKKSVLGAHKGRVKTDIRLPSKLAKRIERTCVKLHLPRNAFFTLAACHELVRLLPMLTAKKRDILRMELESLLQKIKANHDNMQ